jgi:hypothetical protein
MNTATVRDAYVVTGNKALRKGILVEWRWLLRNVGFSDQLFCILDLCKLQAVLKLAS